MAARICLVTVTDVRGIRQWWRSQPEACLKQPCAHSQHSGETHGSRTSDRPLAINPDERIRKDLGESYANEYLSVQFQNVNDFRDHAADYLYLDFYEETP